MRYDITEIWNSETDTSKHVLCHHHWQQDDEYWEKLRDHDTFQKNGKVKRRRVFLCLGCGDMRFR